jgi:hypothetical protein
MSNTSSPGAVIRAGGVMAYSAEPTPRDIAAFSYTLTRAQSDARSVDPDASAPAYFERMLVSLGGLAWTNFDLGTYHYQPGGAPVVPLLALLDVVGARLPTAASAAIAKPMEAVVSALSAAPPVLARLLDAWWGNLHVAGDVRSMFVGPLFAVLGSPQSILGHVRLGFAADSWRDLLVPVDPRALTIDGRLAWLTLNLDKYASIERQLVDSLTEAERQRICDATLDL